MRRCSIRQPATEAQVVSDYSTFETLAVTNETRIATDNLKDPLKRILIIFFPTETLQLVFARRLDKFQTIRGPHKDNFSLTRPAAEAARPTIQWISDAAYGYKVTESASFVQLL